MHRFPSMLELKSMLAQWQLNYDEERIHNSLGRLTSAGFMKKRLTTALGKKIS
jgi:transposase InsO family protein